MKIALITPYYYPFVRGNAVTVRRIARSLVRSGCRTEVYSLDSRSASGIARRMADAPPRLIHAFHGWVGGRVARAIAAQRGIPYIVTLTGTDVYEALTDIRREETFAVLHDAARLVAFDPCIRERLGSPALQEKTVIIPQGVETPGEERRIPEDLIFSGGSFTFLLPAGLRPIKQVLFPLAPLAEIYRYEPRVRLLLAGPVIDPAYAARVMGELERHPFAHYLGGIDHGAIGCLYRRADAVLNTSLFEGGMANSILEAMSLARPVLVADIEGNRAIVREGVTGLLYRTEAEFREKAERLITDPVLARQLGHEAKRLVLEEFSPEREVSAYLELYREVVG